VVSATPSSLLLELDVDDDDDDAISPESLSCAFAPSLPPLELAPPSVAACEASSLPQAINITNIDPPQRPRVIARSIARFDRDHQRRGFFCGVTTATTHHLSCRGSTAT
jgi:hypothetical protein